MSDLNNGHTSNGNDSPSRELLTVEQAAQYLQLSPSSIRAYNREGKLKAFRIDGLRKVIIPRTELLLLLEPTESHQNRYRSRLGNPPIGRILFPII